MDRALLASQGHSGQGGRAPHTEIRRHYHTLLQRWLPKTLGYGSVLRTEDTLSESALQARGPEASGLLELVVRRPRAARPPGDVQELRRSLQDLGGAPTSPPHPAPRKVPGERHPRWGHSPLQDPPGVRPELAPGGGRARALTGGALRTGESLSCPRHARSPRGGR